MAKTTPNANPFASFYEAQTTATAEIVQAALNGMQRLQRLTLEAMRAGAGGQLSLAQSMTSMRDGGDINRAVKDATAPAAEQSARYQRELLQAVATMNNDIVRASYSMMESMRDALGAATQGAMTMPSVLPTGSSDALRNPMALYDSAMRQWQSAVQQMMDTPSVAMAMASAEEYEPSRAPRAAPAYKSKSSAKGKTATRKR